MDYLEKNEISVYRFAKDSGIPQSTIWSIIKKEDYEVREKNIHKICSGMGISVSEIMEPEGDKKVFLRESEIPIVIKYRKLDEQARCRVQGYMDAYISESKRVLRQERKSCNNEKRWAKKVCQI